MGLPAENRKASWQSVLVEANSILGASKNRKGLRGKCFSGSQNDSQNRHENSVSFAVGLETSTKGWQLCQEASQNLMTHH